MTREVARARTAGRHVVLIGLSGSGKSTVAPLLAAALDRSSLDTDTLLAARAGQPVADLLRAGETRFRALEEQALQAALDAPPAVVATGGGIVLSERNRAALAAGPLVVWLRAPSTVLAARVTATAEQRPLLAGGDPVTRLSALLATRAEFYAACAHIVVETAGLAPGEVVETILHYLEPLDQRSTLGAIERGGDDDAVR